MSDDRILSLNLNTGAKMPALGLGTWLSKVGEVGAVVEASLRAGYRHIDCAHIYGNEWEIGEGLRKCFKEGVVKREDIFITSKLWNSEHSIEDVLPACQTTLRNLQLDYLDLYLVHWPIEVKKGAVLRKFKEDEKLGYDPNRMAQCWEGMEELVEKGLVRTIGISNFTITKTEHLLQTAKIVPAVNQVELHPYLQQQKLKEYCESNGIVMVAHSPLGKPGNPYRTSKDPDILQDPKVKEIAAKHRATVGQVCIAFALCRGAAVIPKTAQPARIIENLAAAKLTLDAEDMSRLRDLDRNYRLVSGGYYVKAGESLEDFWDIQEDDKYVLSLQQN